MTDMLLALTSLLAQSSAQFDLTTDIHIAALALENRAVAHTNDSDFGRFRSVRVFSPFQKTLRNTKQQLTSFRRNTYYH